MDTEVSIFLYLKNFHIGKENETRGLGSYVCQVDAGRAESTLKFFELFQLECLGKSYFHSTREAEEMKYLYKLFPYDTLEGMNFFLMTTIHKKGFTLLELLVVVAIIGLLSSLAIVSFRGTRAKARDTRRIEDLKQIRTVLELYYQDFGRYPGMSVSSMEEENWQKLAAYLASYISPLPKDPINAGENIFPYFSGSYAYNYTCSSGGCQDYSLITQLEDTANPNRCELKCWRMNHAEGTNPRPSWCNCPGESGMFSPYIYGDH